MQSYSTSFSLGARLFSRDIREAIAAIYGFVRVADEIVDTFLDAPQAELLEEFTQDTWNALDRRISSNPVLHAFQKVVQDYKIDRKHITYFLRSMKMDLSRFDHDKSSYDEYVLGSAEVVGLMCLHVFVKGDDVLYERLKPSAMKLGSAFQKVNFLRDIRQDSEVLGRQYFPELSTGQQLDSITKAKIESEIQEEFDLAREGIKQLPRGARLGVYVAYIYYRKLLSKIKRTTSDRIMNRRIRVPNRQKFSLLLWSCIRYRLHLI